MRSLNNFSPVSVSCSPACMKYLESVHKPPSSGVITAVPAEPVNPVIHLRDSQCAGTYSPECGSVLYVMYADMLLLCIRLLKAEILFRISVFIMYKYFFSGIMIEFSCLQR